MSTNENLDHTDYSDDQLKTRFGLAAVKVLIDNIDEEVKVRDCSQLDLVNLDLLLSQPREILDVVLQKQLVLIEDNQIESTLRWNNTRLNKIRKLKERWTSTLTVYAAVHILKIREAEEALSTDEEIFDEDEEEEEDPVNLFLRLLNLKLSSEKEDKIDTLDINIPPNDKALNKSFKKNDYHSDHRQISENVRLIYNQIPTYNYEDDPVIIQQFIRKVKVWEELILHHNLLDKYTMYTLLVVKLGELVISAISDDEAEIKSVSNIISFIKRVKKVANQSDDARKRIYQTKQKSGQSPREYYLSLLEINSLIENHSLKVKQFQEAFMNGLNNGILRMRVKEWHDVYKVEHEGEIPSTDRLISQVEIISKGVKPIDVEAPPVFKPRVSSLSSINLGDVWDPKYKTLKLANTPGLRELLDKLKRCLLCREEGCAGVQLITSCPKQKQKPRYEFNYPPTNPLKGIKPRGGRVGGSDNNIIINKCDLINNTKPSFSGLDQEPPIGKLKLVEGQNLVLCGGENVKIPTQNVSIPLDHINNLPITVDLYDKIKDQKEKEKENGESVGVEEEQNLVLCGGEYANIPTLKVSSHIDQINLPTPTTDDFDYTPIIEEFVDSEEVIDNTLLDKWCNLEDRRIFQGQVNGNVANFLDDTGCDGMVIGKNYALKHKLKIISCEAHNVSLADGKTIIDMNEECVVDIRIGKWGKQNVRFSVANIDEDIILSIPFRQSIIVFNDDWINHKFEFRTRSGTRHKWYGCGSKLRINNHRALFMIKQDEFLRQFYNHEEEVFSINLQEREDLGFSTISSITTLQNVVLTPKQQVENFLNTIEEPKLKGILENYIENVFLEPCGILETPHRPEDMKINIKEGSNLRNQPLRRYSAKEDEMIKEKLDELLEKVWIQPSSSNYGTNLLFAKKKDGGYRMCIDYRAINDATIPDRTPLPSHTDLREKVKGAKFLSKLDIRDAFHMIRIDAPDCHKTAFKTRFGLFEYTVCPFGLTNSPATFMRMMNRLFGDLIDKYACYYVDDMMIYSSTYDEHLQHIKEVFDRLRDNTLHVKLSKCQFAVQELEFCGMHISPEGYRICDPQIEAMCNYPSFDPAVDNPKKYTQRFMGSVRFFADFVPCLGELAKPLFDLTTKQNVEEWNVNHQSVMRVIQFLLSTSPTLYFFDPKLATKVHTDASKYAIGGWLGQVQPDGIERVVTYWSRKMISAELNYPVHEQ